jgi:hypothetical protein
MRTSVTVFDGSCEKSDMSEVRAPAMTKKISVIQSFESGKKRFRGTGNCPTDEIEKRHII